MDFSFSVGSFLTDIFLIRKNVVFGKLIQGKEVLKKIERVGDEEGEPTVTVKIIRCGEYSGGTNILLLVTTTATYGVIGEFAVITNPHHRMICQCRQEEAYD